MSRKVVINACYGGFSLSPAAVRRLAEMAGRPCFFFVNARDSHGRLDLNRYAPATEADAEGAFSWSAFDISNPNDVLKSGREWHEMTMEERRAQDALWEAHMLDNRNVPRDNPHLIQVVEELGEAANGSCASLRIVEIPDDVEWEISEYDGNELVAEQHRSWP